MLKICESGSKVYGALCFIHATFLCDWDYFKNEKFRKYVLFESLVDVAITLPKGWTNLYSHNAMRGLVQLFDVAIFI